MSDVDNVIAKLATMEKADLIKVRAMADFLLDNEPSPEGPSATPADPFEQLLYESLSAEMANFGFKAVPYSQFKTGGAYKEWKENWPMAKEFITESFGPKADQKRVQIALCRVAFKQSIMWIRERGVPVSTRTASRAVNKFPQLFDLAFPGYVANGLGYLIPEALLKSKK